MPLIVAAHVGRYVFMWVGVSVSVYCLRMLVFFYTYSTQKRDFVVCTCTKLMSICVSVGVYACRSFSLIIFVSVDVARG